MIIRIVMIFLIIEHFINLNPTAAKINKNGYIIVKNLKNFKMNFKLKMLPIFLMRYHAKHKNHSKYT